jgi:hypothetical protein
VRDKSMYFDNMIESRFAYKGRKIFSIFIIAILSKNMKYFVDSFLFKDFHRLKEKFWILIIIEVSHEHKTISSSSDLMIELLRYGDREDFGSNRIGVSSRYLFCRIHDSNACRRIGRKRG